MKKATLLLFFLLATLLVVVACNGRITPTPPPVTITPTSPPPVANCYDLGTVDTGRYGPIPMETFFVPDQIVLTGDAANFDEVLSQVEEFTFEPVGQGLPPLDGVEPPGYPAPDQQVSVASFSEFNLAGQQYTFSGPGDVGEVMTRVYQVVIDMTQTSGGFPVVFVDPNYVLNYIVTGDPVTDGHEDVGGGGAAGYSAPLVAQEGVDPADRFWEQWAFGARDGGMNGINLTVGGERTVDATGQGIEVAIFDTAPLEPGPHVVDWVMPPFALCVYHPVFTPDIDPSLDERIVEHGLFTTGLVYGVAPESELHLLRVLNEVGQGDLYALLAALHVYTQARLGGNGGNLQNTVYNLSLGIHLEADQYPAADILEELRGVVAEAAPQYLPLLESDAPIPSLQVPFERIGRLGGVVAAAAGNDSDTANAAPLQVPGNYLPVMGVAASNAAGNRSCFSNQGQLAAPGGDGLINGACTPHDMATRCAKIGAEGGVPGCIISLVTKGTSTGNNSGYAYWIGTSFATPMVSGLSALVLETAGGTSPAGVAETIHCGATPGGSGTLPAPDGNDPPGAGLVDVMKTINSCP